jgi:hypothetical protein
MVESQKAGIEWCEAARDIREQFGLDKALACLIGEKFLNFLEASDQDVDFAAEVPGFVSEIRKMFAPPELRTYLEEVRPVGALGHTASEEAYAKMQAARPFVAARSSGRNRFSSFSGRKSCCSRE